MKMMKVALLAAPTMAISQGTALGKCSELTAMEWSWDQVGTYQISRTVAGKQLCLEAASAKAAVQPILQPCNKSDDGQRWVVADGTIALKAAPKFGWVSENGKTTPDGATVWLYEVSSFKGYCDSHKSCNFTFANGMFKNPAESCVAAAALSPTPAPSHPTPAPGPTPHPTPAPSNMAYTCAPGSAESKLPFCNTSLGFEHRSEDLVNRLNITEQIGYFFSYPGTPYIPR